MVQEQRKQRKMNNEEINQNQQSTRQCSDKCVLSCFRSFLSLCHPFALSYAIVHNLIVVLFFATLFFTFLQVRPPNAMRIIRIQRRLITWKWEYYQQLARSVMTRLPSTLFICLFVWIKHFTHFAHLRGSYVRVIVQIHCMCTARLLLCMMCFAVRNTSCNSSITQLARLYTYLLTWPDYTTDSDKEIKLSCSVFFWENVC